jgi:hypothetical protein
VEMEEMLKTGNVTMVVEYIKCLIYLGIVSEKFRSCSACHRPYCEKLEKYALSVELFFRLPR